jgi:hypothetical protein
VQIPERKKEEWFDAEQSGRKFKEMGCVSAIRLKHDVGGVFLLTVL